MNYKSIKSELDKYRREYMKLQKTIDSAKQDHQVIQNDIQTAISKLDRDIEEAKVREQRTYESNAVAPFETALRDLNNTSLSIRQQRDSALSQINVEVYKNNFSEEIDLNNSLITSLETLHEKIAENIGEEFSRKLYSSISTTNVELDYDNIEAVALRFNTLLENVDKLSISKGFDLTKYMNKFLDKIVLNKEDEDYQRKAITLIVIALILTGILVYTVFPFLLILMVVVALLNIKNIYTIYSCIVESKTIADNLDKVNQAIMEKIQEQVNKDFTETQTHYDNKISEITDKIHNTENDMKKALESARESFYFNEEEIMSNHNTAMQSLNDASKISQSRVDELNFQSTNLQKKITNKQQDLLSCVSNLVSESYPTKKLKRGYIFDPKILIDIKDSKPLFFEHPKKSCLFIYKDTDYKDTVNFIKLLLTHIMSNLDCFNYNIALFDVERMCVDFVDLKVNDDLTLYSSEESIIQGYIEDLLTTIKKRLDTIIAEFETLENFNAEMVKLESLTESYIFVFDIISNVERLNNAYSRILNNGDKFGILPHLFVDEAYLLSNHGVGTKLLDSCEFIYAIEGGTLKPRAKEFFLDRLPDK